MAHNEVSYTISNVTYRPGSQVIIHAQTDSLKTIKAYDGCKGTIVGCRHVNDYDGYYAVNLGPLTIEVHHYELVATEVDRGVVPHADGKR